MVTVSEWLEKSKAAHARYRDALPQRVNGHVVPGDREAQILAIIEAQQTRLAALSLDPEQADPSWDAEHAALLTFYAEQLSR